MLLACTMIGAFLGQLPLIGGPPLPALVACIGHLDIRAQAEVLSAPRSATPRRESQCRQSAAVPSTAAPKPVLDASVFRTEARKVLVGDRRYLSKAATTLTGLKVKIVTLTQSWPKAVGRSLAHC